MKDETTVEHIEGKNIEVWQGPTTEERVREIQTWAQKIAGYAADPTHWSVAGELLDGLTIAAEDLGRKMARLRHHLGRCTRGHVIGPTDVCVACGARLVVRT